MSAIACIYRPGGTVPQADGGRMMERLLRHPHRRQGEWHGGTVWFGCLSQPVTPEAVDERLPFYDPDAELAITADAILDNREELFDRLQVPYGRRAGMADSELILLAYRQWGEEAPRFLIGDFAFLIWDGRNRRLFGARDTMGHRSLYYCRQPGQLAFCTVTPPLLALDGVTAALDETWLAEYMAIPEMYESTDPFATCYRAIRQLPPSHTVTARGDGLTFAPYELYGEPSELRLGSDGEYEEAFREVFRQAVTARLRTHKGVSATLSGGLDSGSVVSFAAPELRSQGKLLQTYSYVPVSGFKDWTPRSGVANERPYIESTVAFVGNIADRYLSFEGTSSLDVVDEWLDILDSPYKFFENSYWINGIYKQARDDGAGVLLMGSKGNFSISWGPAVPYYAALLRRMRFARFYREVQSYSRMKGIARTRLLRMIAGEAFPRLRRTASGESVPNMPQLLISPAFARETKVFERMREHNIGLTEPLFRDPGELRRSKLRSLPICNKNGAIATKLSLRYGVLERDPTADPRVIRFCLSVPFEQYVRNGMDRALIRRATAGYLPDNIRLNQRVRGIQSADWVYRMTPAWPAFLRELGELARDPVAGNYLNVDHVRESLSRYGEAPGPEAAFRPGLKVLMRSLILYRFLKRVGAATPERR